MNEQKKAKILYVEDDEALSFLTKDSLSLQGYEIEHCSDGDSGLQSFATNQYDLCILDVMLPGIDGFSIAKKIRKTNQQIPIIFLTAKSMKEDRIEGLKTGADDYITKPYSIEELILKIEVFLRRKFLSSDAVLDVTKLGVYNFDYKNLKLSHEDFEKNLTEKEGDLLDLLVKNRNNILKRSDILQRLWGSDDYFLGRSMDVFISRLRKYLNRDENVKIENVHGVGFRFICPE